MKKSRPSGEVAPGRRVNRAQPAPPDRAGGGQTAISYTKGAVQGVTVQKGSQLPKAGRRVSVEN